MTLSKLIHTALLIMEKKVITFIIVMYCTLGILIIIFMLMTSLIISVLESISVCVLYSVISLSVHFVLLIILAK